MPNRIIKESLCESETIAALSDFEFRLWVTLIVLVDDAGRGDARPAIIKGRGFPLRSRISERDIKDALHGLAAKGCVSLYEVGGKPYFWFPTWGKHQRLDRAKPKHPAPPDFAADCGDLPQTAADCGLNTNTNSNTNKNTNLNINPNRDLNLNSNVGHACAWNAWTDLRKKFSVDMEIALESWLKHKESLGEADDLDTTQKLETFCAEVDSLLAAHGQDAVIDAIHGCIKGGLGQICIRRKK